MPLPFHPLDPLLLVLFLACKLRSVRAVVLLVGLIPAILYALPAEPCGCIRPPFVRCSAGGRELAYRAAMRSDLKNLASQEEIYFSDWGVYSADAAEIGFVSSNGVAIALVATADGWAAQATHDALVDAQACALELGADVPNGFELLDDAEPGELVCTF